MRTLLILLLAFPWVAWADVGLSDADIGEIKEAVAAAGPGTVVQYNEFFSGCPWSKDPACTWQVPIIVSFEGKRTQLVVSQIRGHWLVTTEHRKLLVQGANRAAGVRTIP
jgi:hypothetical protein